MKLKDLVKLPEQEIVKGYDHCCLSSCSGCLSEGKNQALQEIGEMEVPGLDEKEVKEFCREWLNDDEEFEKLLGLLKAICHKFAKPDGQRLELDIADLANFMSIKDRDWEIKNNIEKSIDICNQFSPSVSFPSVEDIEKVIFDCHCNNLKHRFGKRKSEFEMEKVIATSIHNLMKGN